MIGQKGSQFGVCDVMVVKYITLNYYFDKCICLSLLTKKSTSLFQQMLLTKVFTYASVMGSTGDLSLENPRNLGTF